MGYRWGGGGGGGYPVNRHMKWFTDLRLRKQKIQLSFCANYRNNIRKDFPHHYALCLPYFIF